MYKHIAVQSTRLEDAFTEYCINHSKKALESVFFIFLI